MIPPHLKVLVLEIARHKTNLETITVARNSVCEGDISVSKGRFTY